MPNTATKPRPGARTIQSVDRAARILKALASGPRRLGVSELADRLGMTRPTVHGLLQTLQAHGFVEQDRDSDKYQLGAGLLQLGNSYLDLNELRGRSIVHAERLAGRTRAAVRVGVLHGASVVVVHHVFRPDATFQVLEVGAQLPAHASALGKAILAFVRRAVARRPAGRAAAEAHRPDADAARAARRARVGPRARLRARARRGGARRVERGGADLRPRGRTPSARSASSATPSVCCLAAPPRAWRRRSSRRPRRLARARRPPLARGPVLATGLAVPAGERVPRLRTAGKAA